MDLVGGDEQQDGVGKAVRSGGKSGSERVSAQDREAVAKQQFEQRLKDRSRGTFILYERLDEEQQVQVIKEYTETGDLRRARSKIMRFTKDR